VKQQLLDFSALPDPSEVDISVVEDHSNLELYYLEALAPPPAKSGAL